MNRNNSPVKKISYYLIYTEKNQSYSRIEMPLKLTMLGNKESECNASVNHFKKIFKKARLQKIIICSVKKYVKRGIKVPNITLYGGIHLQIIHHKMTIITNT